MERCRFVFAPPCPYRAVVGCGQGAMMQSKFVLGAAPPPAVGLDGGADDGTEFALVAEVAAGGAGVLLAGDRSCPPASSSPPASSTPVTSAATNHAATRAAARLGIGIAAHLLSSLTLTARYGFPQDTHNFGKDALPIDFGQNV